MPTQLIAQILAYLGAAIGVIVVLPQILRTMRHPHLTGVSATLVAATVALGTAVALVTMESSRRLQPPEQSLASRGA